MHGLGRSRTPLAALLGRARAWPETSQLQARRNAMLASTACAQQRHERQEVEEYLASRESDEPGSPLGVDGEPEKPDEPRAEQA